MGRLDERLLGAEPIAVRLVVCDKNKKRNPCRPVEHEPACCQKCGKAFQRCNTHGALSGARRSLGSHKGIGMCDLPATTAEDVTVVTLRR